MRFEMQQFSNYTSPHTSDCVTQPLVESATQPVSEYMNHQQFLINGTVPVANGAAMQTLQHYLVNQMPNQLNQNVHVQSVKQEQQSQRINIINRLSQQGLVNGQIQIMRQLEAQPVFWLIVDIESNNEQNMYALVESKDVENQPQLENLNTGKSVVVNINGKNYRASVVMASADKNFITAEYSQLTKMAEDNLKLRSDGQIRKRRRLSITEVRDDDSTRSGWSGVSQSANTDRVLSPSTRVQPQKIESRSYPPMVFDQGTQTDNRMTEGMAGIQMKMMELQKLIDLNEQMLNEQKLIKNEANIGRLLIESFSEEFVAMRKSMQVIETKIDGLSNERGQFEAIAHDEDVTLNKKKILNGSGQQVYYIETAANNSENASFALNHSAVDEYTVEEVEADDSGRSTSRMSYHDQTSMMSNSSVDYSLNKKESFRRSHSSSNFSVHSASSTPIARANSIPSLVEEWVDVEGDVTIGSHKTMVPVHVLRAIDWKNYKTATRKLLTTLFTREILATRSLTGRPSPAFHDRNKPVKGKLDQDIINDIIQVVTRKCSVQDSLVRTAITTKCADENKMMRNRKDNEEKFKTPNASTSNRATDNKENVVEN